MFMQVAFMPRKGGGRNANSRQFAPRSGKAGKKRRAVWKRQKISGKRPFWEGRFLEGARYPKKSEKKSKKGLAGFSTLYYKVEVWNRIGRLNVWMSSGR
jgi:hypothetical protein